MNDDVTVTAFGMFREQLPEDATVAPGQTVGQAVGSLQLDMVEAVVVAVNGRVVDWKYVLQPGDRLELVPAIGGGSIDGKAREGETIG